jgi:hypothetical protein
MIKIGMILVAGVLFSIAAVADSKNTNNEKVPSKKTITASSDYVGDWKLNEKSEGFPCPCEIGSAFKIKKDGTFSVVSDHGNMSGKYEVKGDVFTLIFDKNSSYTFSYTADKKVLSLVCKTAKGTAKATYLKS